MSIAHFSGPPAMPTTRAPAIFAICAATEPTAPAAADTTTVSPSWGRPMSCMPTYAVRPVMPRTPRNELVVTPGISGITNAPAASDSTA